MAGSNIHEYIKLRQYFINLTLRADPENPLPSERTLAEMFGVARKTVRRALEDMVRDRYLIKRPRRGYFVNPFSMREDERRMKIIGILHRNGMHALYNQEDARFMEEFFREIRRYRACAQLIMTSNPEMIYNDIVNSKLDGLVWLGVPKPHIPVFERIHRENVVYVDEEQLRFHPLAEWIFSKTELPEYLLNILDRLMREERQEEDIEKEFLFAIYAELRNLQDVFGKEGIRPEEKRNLQDVFGKEGIRPEEKLYAQIIEKVIGGITIPFSGEPLEGLQLMGLMETRMLDFKHLVILSANEGTLPRTTMPSSFIPYNLRVGFRLPTPEHQDALFAYYFYRLLQRAKDVHVLYSEGTKGVNGGEMSRYLYQIKYESGLTVEERSLQNLISTPSPQEITIAKTGEVRETLAQYEKSAERLLSPSALNTYMECGLRFYFKYVAGIEEKEEVAEELDARLLGTIFHEASQSLYATVPKGLVTREVIEGLLADEKQMERHILDAYRKVYDVRISRLMESGNNELVLNAVKKYIRQMLEYDKRVAPFRMVAMETRFHVPVEVEIGGAVHRVYIGGFIDRVDQTDEGIRIIDYKTGSDTTDFKDIASVFDTENPTRNKAAFQTMLYCLMYDYERPGTLPLIPGIYNTKLLFGKDYDYHLICEKTPMADFRRFEGEYVESLRRLLARLFSPDEPFRQTEDEKKCPNCPYAGICRR